MKLLLVCEGDGDDDDLKVITLKVLHEPHPWMVGLESLEAPTPEWFEYERGRGFLRWGDVAKARVARRVPRVHGLGMHLGRRMATRLTRMLSLPSVLPPGDAIRVVMVHDTDRLPGWRESLEAARDEWLAWLDDQERLKLRGHTDANVAVGVAHPEHEAWQLAAFEPKGNRERTRLTSVQAQLGFDPRLDGERLTSMRVTDSRDAKRVLDAVCGDSERQRAILEEASLDLLRARGVAVGLTAFLDELKARVVDAYGPTAYSPP